MIRFGLHWLIFCKSFQKVAAIPVAFLISDNREYFWSGNGNGNGYEDVINNYINNKGNNNDDNDDDDVLFIPPGIIVIASLCSCVMAIALVVGMISVANDIISRFKPVALTTDEPGSFDDEQTMLEEDNRALVELTPNEQELYFQAKDFMKLNPIDRSDLTLSQALSIEEKGVSAWEFKPNINAFREIQVVNKSEINFNQTLPGSELSIQTNIPIPRVNDVYYFECKIYTLPNPENTIISLGIATSPYPFFRLPGRHRFSIAYDSNGDRRFNQPFKLENKNGLKIFPELEVADVVGIGYRTQSGTIFFTRNGKKLSESKIGGHIKGFRPTKIYPTIGSTNKCCVHVNMGQAGFVFIEGNVKKWGFAPLEGKGLPPPAYKAFNEDVLLESSSEYSDGDEEFPPDFWDATKASFTDTENGGDENYTLNSLPRDPPLYTSDEEELSGEIREGSSRDLEHLGRIEDNDVDDEGDTADGEDNSDDED
ncbi:hypothetical protein PACTADRAFT_34830 [Pachysolen tannophilus NRRL Y-2460]|uniref:B30.2/SPRY domain-containing protein n=1 Tax=Pachysolen tannophilus NRRL Y-2460 TaxID=669874 RepID=A0A1E4TTH6_PACTA|nr:hypothetical protein PACTADRAFT_34830 [Pachysolen tannophilus NRRL Y-2460]